MRLGFRLAALALAAMALPAAAKPLCEAGERELFQCVTRTGRTAAVCAPHTAAEPVLVYRFGRPGRIEVQHPSGLQPATETFTKNYLSWPKGTSTQLGFQMGDVRYTVFTWSSSYEGVHSGILIERAGKKARTIHCTVNDRMELPFIVQSLPLREHDYRDTP